MLEGEAIFPSNLKPMIDEIHQLISHCGKPEFSAVLMAFLNRLADVDHLAVFMFDQQLIPRQVVAESAAPENLAKKAGQAYANSYFYRHDPNTTQVRSIQENSSGPMLMRLKASNISDPEYRDKIYHHFGLIDRLSLIDSINGHWVVVSCYRDTKTGEFSKPDVEAVQLMAGLISALLEKNFTLLPPSVWTTATRPTPKMLENILSSLGAALSRREVEVCALALLGMTSNGIGLELGIQPPTVSTLRKRAYEKLNISGLNELFALCLSKAVVDTGMPRMDKEC